MMASLRLQPQSRLILRNRMSDQGGARDLVASGLNSEDDNCQVCTLLYCLGNEAEDVLRSTNILE